MDIGGGSQSLWWWVQVVPLNTKSSTLLQKNTHDKKYPRFQKQMKQSFSIPEPCVRYLPSMDGMGPNWGELEGNETLVKKSQLECVMLLQEMVLSNLCYLIPQKFFILPRFQTGLNYPPPLFQLSFSRFCLIYNSNAFLCSKEPEYSIHKPSPNISIYLMIMLCFFNYREATFLSLQWELQSFGNIAEFPISTLSPSFRHLHSIRDPIVPFRCVHRIGSLGLIVLPKAQLTIRMGVISYISWMQSATYSALPSTLGVCSDNHEQVWREVGPDKSYFSLLLSLFIYLSYMHTHLSQV